ncbi:MAG: hypothetical protein IPP90_21040 [Gemmatimonadaceae bacterium]|nr:hypothetical protein [Gemmatimonadaceae bacterium]
MRIRDAIFQGSSERLFAQLVNDEGLGREELERMRTLLAAGSLAADAEERLHEQLDAVFCTHRRPGGAGGDRRDTMPAPAPRSARSAGSGLVPWAPLSR